MSKDLTQHGQPANHNTTPGTRADGAPSALEVDDKGGLITNPKALRKDLDSVAASIIPGDSKIGITASAQLLAGPGKLKGFLLISHTAGATVRFSDALTATTPYVSSAWTSVAGNLAGSYIMVAQNGIKMATGCYCTITGTIEILPDVEAD